jgi:hypothetical protein
MLSPGVQIYSFLLEYVFREYMKTDGSRIYLDKFDGIAPIFDPKLLPVHNAQTAQNVDLQAGRIDSWKIPLSVQATPGNVSVYPWRRNGSTQWLGWNTDVDVVQSPVADDDYDRIYYTGDGVPKVKGWDGGEVTKNMSQTQAGTPVATTSLLLSDAAIAGSSLVVYGYMNNGSTEYTSAGFPLSGVYKSHERKDNQIILKYEYRYKPIWAFGSVIYTYFQLTFGGGTITPSSKDKSTLVGKTITITGVGTATIKNAEEVVVQHDPLYPATYEDIYSLTITINMDYGDGNNSIRYCYYVQTLVNEWGMEGPPSSISNQVTWNPGEKVVLSSLGAGATDTTLRRFYRSAAGTSEDAFYYLDEKTVGTTSYTDTKSDAQLSEELPLFENAPDGLSGLVMMPGGWAVGFVGRQVCPSIPYYPWSYPTDYRITVDFDIIGLGVSGNDLYVLTKGNPYLVTGYHPESTTVSKMPISQSCVSKRSIATMGRMILYACPDGVEGLMAGQGRLMTEKLYGRADWQAITPSGIIGGVNDERYFCFHATGGVIFRFSDGADAVTTTDQVVTGLYSDLEDDTLYIIQGTLKSWNRGATNMTVLWKSKEFASNRRTNWSCGRIVASAYPLTLYLYGETALLATVTVTDQTSFRLPIMDPVRTWSLAVEGAVSFDLVAIASSMNNLI